VSIDDANTVWPEQADAIPARDPEALAFQRHTFQARFPETGRNDHGRAYAALAACFQYLHCCLRRDNEDRKIHGIRYAADASEQWPVKQASCLLTHEMDGPLISALYKIPRNTVAELAG
jgi:hypothetical protein